MCSKLTGCSMPTAAPMSDGAPARGPHGWLVVDKPRGITSAAAVARIKSVCGRGAKVGHAGTLDPMATGVLPVAIGEATKTVSFMMDALKRYRFGVRWGEQRDTDDAEGTVIETSESRPSREAVANALSAFIGRIEQVPPAYSALKVGGERAYALARQGRAPELAPRTVHIESLTLIEAGDEGAAFAVECGKGTYVRALARDIARALGTVGYVSWLHRAAVGPFSDDDANPLDKLVALGHSPGPRRKPATGRCSAGRHPGSATDRTRGRSSAPRPARARARRRTRKGPRRCRVTTRGVGRSRRGPGPPVAGLQHVTSGVTRCRSPRRGRPS